MAALPGQDIPSPTQDQNRIERPLPKGRTWTYLHLPLNRMPHTCVNVTFLCITYVVGNKRYLFNARLEMAQSDMRNNIVKWSTTSKTRRSSCVTARGVLPAVLPVYGVPCLGVGRGYPCPGSVWGVGYPCSRPDRGPLNSSPGKDLGLGYPHPERTRDQRLGHLLPLGKGQEPDWRTPWSRIRDQRHKMKRLHSLVLHTRTVTISIINLTLIKIDNCLHWNTRHFK